MLVHVVSLDGTHHRGRVREVTLTREGVPVMLHLCMADGTLPDRVLPWVTVREVCRVG